MKYSIGLHGSHNSTIVLFCDNELLEVLELERLLSVKNVAFFWYYAVEEKRADYLLDWIDKYFRAKYGIIDKYEHVAYNSVHLHQIDKFFPANNYKWVPHHQCHAYSSLYQSDDDIALTFSFDGDSDERFFNVYLSEKCKDVVKIGTNDFDFAVPYMMAAHFCEEIREEEIYWGNLVYGGKIMGLSAYGEIDQDLYEKLESFYRKTPGGDISKTLERWHSEMGISERIKGADTLARTNQKVFEDLFLEVAQPYFQKYPNLPIHIVGGCGLNILNNSKIRDIRPTFVSPNSNDTGIALGAICSVLRPEKVDVTYRGSEVWDKHMLPYYLDNEIQTFTTLVEDLCKGKVVGIVNGRGEHGPRALGNRSILCLPGEGMKHTLNSKVKNREFYRPFAPVVRFEDVGKYFKHNEESRWMTFATEVKEEYTKDLASVSHYDKTARVQTVTAGQCPYIHGLLSQMELKGVLPVLINTSFNRAGKLILNTYKEAKEVFEHTEMDGLVLDYKYIQK